MSLSSPDIAIALLPGRAVLRAGGRLLDQAVGEGWEGTLEALRGLLGKADARGAAAVVLSHHFSRPMLLAPPPVRLSAAEMDGWIGASLAELYGAEADAWRAAWQDVPPGRPLPVAVMESVRLEQLLALGRESGLSLERVEPWFAAAWNRFRRDMVGGTGWLALLEPGRIALARIEQGRPAGLRLSQCGADPAGELSALLARESLHGGVTGKGELWLAATGVELPVTGSLAGYAPRALLPAGADAAGWLP